MSTRNLTSRKGKRDRDERRENEKEGEKKRNNLLVKNEVIAGHYWFTPVILATQEAEIRRIMV
jgi:hypothetical protein